MKLEDLIYDIKHMLMALSNTTTVLDGDIIDKLAYYRMAYISQYWIKNQRVLEEWFQNVTTTRFDPWATPYSIMVADHLQVVTGVKTVIPKVITMPNGIHFRITESESGKKVYPINYDSLLMMIELEDARLSRFPYFAHKGNILFSYPSTSLNVNAILQEPTNGVSDSVLTTATHGTLVAGTLYTVVSGAITYGLAGWRRYNAGETFLADEGSDWTDVLPVISDGHTIPAAVLTSTQLGAFDYFSEYPLDVAGAQEIILEILTKDYAIRSKAVSDVLEDGVDQFKILTSRT